MVCDYWVYVEIKVFLCSGRIVAVHEISDFKIFTKERVHLEGKIYRVLRIGVCIVS